MDETSSAPTDRTRLRRKTERGHHDFATVAAILDEGLVCHVGFAVERRPWVFPTVYGRIGDRVYLHGATANFALRTLTAGVEVCVTVTLVDGLVLARSAFHHSMNYRSVMLFGRAEPVRDEEEKRRAATAIVEHLVPGRSADCRAPTSEELRATLMVSIPLDEASAKIRTGGPVEEPDDLALPHWAGALPLHLSPGEPVTDRVPTRADPEVPDYLRTWSATDRATGPV